MTVESTSAKSKPALDESAFQQLLAAAYVVQEHNDTLSARRPHVKNTQVPSEITEIESLAHAGALDVSAAAKLITDRVLKVVGAAGTSVSLISNGYLDCVAESGIPATIPGSSVASHSLVATERLKAGEMFESADARTDIRLDESLCEKLGVGSLVALPVLRLGELAGLIEVRWARSSAFEESDLSVCRLMAEVLTGILEQQALSLRQKNNSGPESGQAAAVASPDLSNEAASAGTAPGNEAAPISRDSRVRVSYTTTPKGQQTGSEDTQASAAGFAHSCRVCGRPFRADEVFCGYCSMPRTTPSPSDGLQSKWASLWYIQKAQGTLEDQEERATSVSAHVPRPVAANNLPSSNSASPSVSTPAPDVANFTYFEPATIESRDATEEDYLENVSPWSRLVRALPHKLRARDVLLILVAAVLTFGVISAWPSSTGQLTWFGSAIVRLGLARSARTPVQGGSQIKVWVDTHTGLYYCPGADLYGTTPEGSYVSQRDAQIQHIEPAAGLACQ